MFENVQCSKIRLLTMYYGNMTAKKAPEDIKPIRDLNGVILCKGPCGKNLTATEEHFFFRKSSKNGRFYPSSYCKICERARSAASRKARYSSKEGEAIRIQNQTWRSEHPEYAESKRIKQNKKYMTDAAYRTLRKAQATAWRIRFPLKRQTTKASYHQRTKKRSYLKRALFATFYPDLKLRGVLRTAICEAIKIHGGSKGGRSILTHLPYTMEELKSYLESLWESWMNWANYGPWSAHRRTWQIDHIIPQALLPFSDFSDANFLKCWALSNLRPLESSKNIQKGCKF
jgi:hypothetical protein